MKNLKLRALITGAAIAAVYTVLCVALAPISYGMIQFRISEVLCILPLFFPEAIPGLFIGCLLSNLLGGAGILDIIFGSLATLLAALCTYGLRRIPLLAIAMPVVFNGLIIAVVLHFAVAAPLLVTMGSIALSEAVILYAGGYPLYLVLRRTKFVLDRTGGTPEPKDPYHQP